MLQQSPDGTPVAALTSDPVPIDLVMPYVGSGSSDIDLVHSQYFPVILAFAAFFVVAIVVIIVVCLVYKHKRKKRW